MSLEKISLIIPIRNESESIKELIKSIELQTMLPDEVILVDGGSVDDTVNIVKTLIKDNLRYRIVEVEDATPGRGRNIGIERARNQWISLTDAGIVLDKDWLRNLAAAGIADSSVEIIYGNFEPLMDSLFEKCAAFTYVQAKKKNAIRENSVASLLMKKSVWEKVGGFPDLRATEDLIFMEAVIDNKIKTGTAPEALIYWRLPPDLTSLFYKFTLYSKHNVINHRQWDWHYGLLRQYIFLIPVILLSVFHSYWWLIVVLFWLIARVAKRVPANYYQYGFSPLFNPIQFFTILAIIITIDIATLVGWIQAKIT